MYKTIGNQFPANFPYNDYSNLCNIYALSDIRQQLAKKRNAKTYDFITSPGYPDETIFKGFGNATTWISLNLVEHSEKLLLHTTMTDHLGTDVTALYGFQPGAHLYEVGNMSEPEKVLIGKINSIVKRLK